MPVFFISPPLPNDLPTPDNKGWTNISLHAVVHPPMRERNVINKAYYLLPNVPLPLEL